MLALEMGFESKRLKKFKFPTSPKGPPSAVALTSAFIGNNSGRVRTRTPLRVYSEPEALQPSTPRADPFDFVSEARDGSGG